MVLGSITLLASSYPQDPPLFLFYSYLLNVIAQVPHLPDLSNRGQACGARDRRDIPPTPIAAPNPLRGCAHRKKQTAHGRVSSHKLLLHRAQSPPPNQHKPAQLFLRLQQVCCECCSTRTKLAQNVPLTNAEVSGMRRVRTWFLLLFAFWWACMGR